MKNLVLGRALQRQGQSKRAMQTLLDGLALTQEQAGDETGYWLAIADLEHEAGQFETALSLHHRALALARSDQQQCSAQLGLAADLWAMGEESTASALQEQALAFPALNADPVLLEQSARLYQLQQQWHLALPQLEAAANALSDAEVLHLAILRLYLRLDRVEGLATAVEKAVAMLDSAAYSHESLLLLLAQASQRLARYPEAVAFYQMAMLQQTEQKKVKKRPRRLLDVEFKLQQTTSEIEIDLLRHKNALQHEQVRQLESATFRDALTGLHNHRYLKARWEEVMTQAHQSHALCVMHLGVDQSTHLRDVMGDAVADECAQRIANVLRRCCPKYAELIAANNNEFRIIWPQVTPEHVVQLAADIQQEVSELDCSQLPEPLTVSIGCTAYQPGDSVDVLQLRADLALYLAMRRGAGAVVWEGVA